MATAGGEDAKVEARDHLKIAIVCLSTFGGSELVTTQLGMALSRGGDKIPRCWVQVHVYD